MINKSTLMLAAAVVVSAVASPVFAHPLHNVASRVPETAKITARQSGLLAYDMLPSGISYNSDGGYSKSGYDGGIETQR